MDFIKAYEFKKNQKVIDYSVINNRVTSIAGNQAVFTGSTALGGGVHSSAIFKTDQDGEVLWAKDINQVVIRNIKVLENGEVLILGIKDFALKNHTTIIKLNKAGDILWDIILDYSISIFEPGISINITNSGDYVFCWPSYDGSTSTNITYFIKINANGQIRKTLSLENTSQDRSYQLLHDKFEDTLVLFNYKYSSSYNNSDFYVDTVVLDSNLVVQKKAQLKIPHTTLGDLGIIKAANINENYYRFIVSLGSSAVDIYIKLPKELLLGNTTVHTIPGEKSSLGFHYFDNQIAYKLRNGKIEKRDFENNLLESFQVTTSNGKHLTPTYFSDDHFFNGRNSNTDPSGTVYVYHKSFQKCATVHNQTSETLNLSPINATLENWPWAFTEVTPPVLNESPTVTDLSWQETAICAPIRNLQSPHMYFQATGSTGADGSAQGIHLRWMFKQQLANHLPKGNLATTTHHLNKPDDFVKIYRAPYTPQYINLNFNTAPFTIDDLNKVWLYQFDFHLVHVHFRNSSKYDTVRATIDPATNSMGFIQNYGADLIEIEAQSNLFFSVKLTPNNIQASSQLQVECLSVEENKISSPKSVIARQTFNQTSLSSSYLAIENGRSVQYKAVDCIIEEVTLEFYDELVKDINGNDAWQEIGQFALTTDNTEAFNRLEPSPGLVHGQWPRYNDNTFVNTANYQEKWSGTRTAPDRNIKEVVQQYLTLSDQADNPTGTETINFTTDDNEPDGIEISNLDMLQLASLDYHVARMLGLGYLDTDPVIMSGKFVYKAEYITTADLGDGEGARQVKHTYISLPTSTNDERLPYPVDLKQPMLGLPHSSEGNAENPVLLTDAQGYTQDGKTRFLTLYAEDLPDFEQQGFFATPDNFNLSNTTFPVYAGVEYKTLGQDWQKPELLHTPEYLAAVPNGTTAYGESIPLHIPESHEALYIHREKQHGNHVYGSYGVNWFGRATRSNVTWQVNTLFQPKNPLRPPSNLQPLLVREESPLVLTSTQEQQRLANITTADKTLVRLTFDYHSLQELISYKITPEDLAPHTDALNPDAIFPDNEEIFANEIEIFFRNQPPTNISGKAKRVTQDPSDAAVAIVRTERYHIASNNQYLVPVVATERMANFAGGVLVLEEEQFIIKEVLPADTAGEGPIIKVYKQEISDGISFNTLPNPNADLQAPIIKGDGKLLAVENMQNTHAWGTANPHSFKVQIGANWGIHREVVQQAGASSAPDDILEKSRGIWTENATITPESELVEQLDAQGQVVLDANGQVVTTTVHRGLYKITFNGLKLAEHPQYNDSLVSAEWFQGIVRVFTQGSITTGLPNKTRKILEVAKIDNVGTNNDLVVYVQDPTFSPEAGYDTIQTGNNISVNFYPGYKVYLYANNTLGLNEANVLPTTGESIKYSVLGLRSATATTYSNMSAPQMMFAQEVIAPLQPAPPQGALYATRPDTFGKSAYTLVTQFNHAPHAVLYYRASEQVILNALYTADTIKTIKTALAGLADQSYENSRWKNLLGFDYTYTDALNTSGQFGVFPPTNEGYRLPNPDKPTLFATGETPGSILPGNMLARIQEAVWNTFLPLTEVPLLYEHIKGQTYQPIAKSQVIRGRNGALLKPNHPDFDIAPMAKKTGNNQVLFTDFSLDGTSNNLYFYAVREMGNTMQLGEFSQILGPVTLVNTQAPPAPQIKRVLPVLADLVSTEPSVQFELNAYAQTQHIKKVNIFRTMEPANTLSVRTMELVHTVELNKAQQLQDNIWQVNDDLSSFDFIPFGEPIYYRLTVDREVNYADKNGQVVTEYAASLPSKLLISQVVESTSPVSPTLTFESQPINIQSAINEVVIHWQKTTHNGKYHLYKMNTQGNWIKIHEIASNDASITVALAQTNLGSGTLLLRNAAGQKIYHHFKVEAENSAGLFSPEENILTITSDETNTEVLTLLYQQLLPTQISTGNNFNTGLVCNLAINDHIALQVNGLHMVLDKNSLTQGAYFSKDGGTTATDDFQGATLYWNTQIAGFALAPSDNVWLFNAHGVDYSQPLPVTGSFVHQVLPVAQVSSGNQFNTGAICTLALNGQLILAVNDLRMLVTKDSLTQPAYFSKDGGLTATDDFQGATLFWNTTIAGFSLAPTDQVKVFNIYPVDQTLLT